MILYHGSYTVVKNPDLSYSRLRTDFGKGFYLTAHEAQAISWATRFKHKHGAAYVSWYEFMHGIDTIFPAEIRVLEFDTHSIEWLDFITACRLGLSDDEDWDIVIGGVANDKVFDTLQLYFDGLIEAQVAIGRLRYNKPNFQYCFKQQDIINKYLRFLDSEEI